MTPAVFLDRDGVLIEDRIVTAVRHVTFITGAMRAVRLLHDAGFKLVMWSNQGGNVAIAGEAVIRDIMRHVQRCIADDTDAIVDTRFCCYHRVIERCACRKPSPLLLWTAAEELNIDLSRSYVIEDYPINLQAAQTVGARGVMVLSGRGRLAEAPFGVPCVRDLITAARFISKKLSHASH